jgi:Predicted redox protein, regulator of disulfide bond formation
MKTTDITPDKEVDACGLMCPLPILRARKALSEMASGEILRVYATDPGSKQDFLSFTKQTGNRLLASGENAEGKYWFILARK